MTSRVQRPNRLVYIEVVHCVNCEGFSNGERDCAGCQAATNMRTAKISSALTSNCREDPQQPLPHLALHVAAANFTASKVLEACPHLFPFLSIVL